MLAIIQALLYSRCEAYNYILTYTKYIIALECAKEEEKKRKREKEIEKKKKKEKEKEKRKK